MHGRERPTFDSAADGTKNQGNHRGPGTHVFIAPPPYCDAPQALSFAARTTNRQFYVD
jgi:hypothetical protein